MRSIYLFSILFAFSGFSQNSEATIYEIIDKISEKRIEKDVVKLANFGTRNTFSDTVSNT